MSPIIITEQGSTPATPAAGKWKLYPKADGWYALDDAGNEIGPLSTGSGGSNSICDGRLTLETGVPVSVTDQTAKTSVYFTPYKGNMINLDDGSESWATFLEFTEKSVAVPSTTNTPFDIFGYDNAGVLALETLNWTNDTARATALAWSKGVRIKSGAPTRRYLGTGRTTGVSGQCEDSAGGTHQAGGKRFLWNNYNRVLRALKVIDTTDSWSYATGTWRQANNASSNKVEFVVGVAEDIVKADLYVSVSLASNSARAASVGIGIDSVTAGSGMRHGGFNISANTLIAPTSATHAYNPAEGYHYLAWLEFGADGTCTWQGDANAAANGLQSGLIAMMFG